MRRSAAGLPRGFLIRTNVGSSFCLFFIELLKVYYASTTLRLYQPPPVETAVLQSLSASLTTILPGVPSTIDIFYRAKSALEGFFDSFLTLPTESWTVMPLFTMLQSVWSITMLARWAKVMGPGRSRPAASNAPPDILAPQKVIWDPSSRRHRTRLRPRAGKAPAPTPETPIAASRSRERDTSSHVSTHDSSTNASTSSNSGNVAQIQIHNTLPATIITDPAQISAAQLREAADPDLPRAAAALRAELRAQPGLDLDMVGILSALARRCAQAHERLARGDDDDDDSTWQTDIWYLCEKKVLIARAKLEKWAEIIAAGGVPPDAGRKTTTTTTTTSARRDHGDVEMGNSNTSGLFQEPAAASGQPTHQHHQHTEEETMAVFQRQIETAAQGILPPEVMYSADMYGGFWTDSMFDPLDPSLWLNDGSDWGMALVGATQDMPTGS